jgi:hypothetical protein
MPKIPDKHLSYANILGHIEGHDLMRCLKKMCVDESAQTIGYALSLVPPWKVEEALARVLCTHGAPKR